MSLIADNWAIYEYSNDHLATSNLVQRLCCEIESRDWLAGEVGIESVLQGGSLKVLFVDLRDQAWVDLKMVEAYNNKRPHLILGFEPGKVWISTYWDGITRACFSCLRSRLLNNHNEENAWYGNIQHRTRNSRIATRPSCSIIDDMIGNQIRVVLSALFGEKNNETYHNVVRKIELDSATVTEHKFHVYPGCAVCDRLPEDRADVDFKLQPRLKDSTHSARPKNKKLTIENVEDAYVDRLTGQVKHIFDSLNSELMPMYTAEAAVAGTNQIESGYGRTANKNQSKMVSILESLERISSHKPRNIGGWTRGSYSSLKDNAINPKAFILHDELQRNEPSYAYVRYSEDLEFDWKWSYSLVSKSPKLVPQQLVYYWLNDSERSNKINRFVYESSNGCALGSSVEEAAYFGLLEVIERDAFLTTWYGKFSPPEIDLDTIADSRSRSLITRAKEEGYELHLFDIRIDIDVPSILGMIVNPATDAPVKSYCASGSNVDPEEAIFSALVEITTSISIYEKNLPQYRDKAKAMLDDSSKVMDMSDHVLLYSHPESYHRLQFLFSDKPKVSVQAAYKDYYSKEPNIDLTRDLTDLVKKVEQVASDVLLVDLSYDALKDVGLKSVKIFAPGLNTISFGHRYRRPSLGRVARAAEKLGYPLIQSRQDLNQDPHNFP